MGGIMQENLNVEETLEVEETPLQVEEEETKAEKKEEGGEKKYTDEDLDRIINKKFAKWEEKQSEAVKLAKMNEKERAEHERDQLQKRLDELERKEILNAMSAEARKMFHEKDLKVSEELISSLVREDAEETKTVVSSVISLLETAIEEGVNAKISSKTPKRGLKNNALTKEDIFKIKDPVERQRKIAENLELFD